MTVSSAQQMNMFLISIVVGAACALIFDLQRFVRRIRKTGEVLTNIEDFLFAITLTIAVIASGYAFNRGRLRYYQMLGAAFGMFVYTLFFSRFVMRLLGIVFKIFVKIILRPIAFIIGVVLNFLVHLKMAVRRILKKAAGEIKTYAHFMRTGAKSLKKSIKML